MKYILKCSKCNSEDLQAIEHVVNDIKQKDMYICNECSELMEPEEVLIGEFDKYYDNIENKDRDFTLDELVFMQGHLTWVQEYIEHRLKEGLYERKDIAIRKINTLKEINKKIRKLFDTY